MNLQIKTCAVFFKNHQHFEIYEMRELWPFFPLNSCNSDSYWWINDMCKWWPYKLAESFRSLECVSFMSRDFAMENTCSLPTTMWKRDSVGCQLHPLLLVQWKTIIPKNSIGANLYSNGVCFLLPIQFGLVFNSQVIPREVCRFPLTFSK